MPETLDEELERKEMARRKRLKKTIAPSMASENLPEDATDKNAMDEEEDTTLYGKFKRMVMGRKKKAGPDSAGEQAAALRRGKKTEDE